MINIQGERVIDLSQITEPGIPTPGSFPPPKIGIMLSQARGDGANAEIVTLAIHTGTHCDAPFHFFSELKTIDQIPPDCLIGPAVVVDVRHRTGNVAITRADLEAWEAQSGDPIRADDIVLFHTGHSAHWHGGLYARDWPYLGRDAVEYLAEKSIRAIGLETLDPDPYVTDFSTAEFIAHRTFLPKGIYIIENLTNLDQIPGTRCTIIALPLKLKGCSGSPVRVVAVV